MSMNKTNKGSWSAKLTPTRAYYNPFGVTEEPAYIRVQAESIDGSWSKSVDLPRNELTTAGLKKAFPRLRYNGSGKSDIGAEVIEKLYQKIGNETIERGYVFSQMGAYQLPSGNTVFVRGKEIIGKVYRPYIIVDAPEKFQLRGKDVDLQSFVSMLLKVQLPALLLLAFVLLSSIRSLLIEAGIALQAVLVIEGKQGVGKTTLATKIGAVYRNLVTKRSAGVLQLSGTFASIRDGLLELRDSLVILDDLCLSSSRRIQQSSLDSASKIMRMATGDIPLTKKNGKQTVELPAEALAAITAEYTFDNLSDLTRSIIVPLHEQMELPDALTPDLSGAVVRHFSEWVCENREAFIERMKTAARGGEIRDTFDQRLRTNYGLLLGIWDEFLLSLEEKLEIDVNLIQMSRRIFRSAVEEALAEHNTLIEKLKSNFKRGNLAYIILGLLDAGELRPGKKYIEDVEDRAKRFKRRSCILMKNGDLGVDPEALLQLVREQPGYKNATRNSVAQELKDIGALVLQRNGKNTTAMVKLWHQGKWGYRIKLGVLEDVQEAF